MNELLKVAQFFNTKLCHDIAGLIGAINNAIDYSNNPDESIRLQAKSLLDNSSKEAMKRLTFYREAYGVIRNENVQIYLVKKFLEDFLNVDKFSIIIQNSSNIDNISEMNLKLCLLMGNMGSNVLGRGGSILFDFSPSDEGKILLSQIILSGKMIIKKDEILKILKGETVEINSSNINGYYIYLLAKELGQKIEIDSTNNEKLIYKFI
jgi:histidine phosphotransferase ChpT